MKYSAEVLATFFLVFCGTGAIVVNEEYNNAISHVGIAVVFGASVTTMILAFGKTSGAHMNPAVTLVMAIAKQFPPRQILPYMVAQILGALLASLTLAWLFPNNVFLGATVPGTIPLKAFVVECVLTFLLVLVIFKVTQNSAQSIMLPAAAIGLVVGIEAMFAGPITGASMNPVRSLAPAVVSGQYEALWIYLTAPFIGALLAYLVHILFKSSE